MPRSAPKIPEKRGYRKSRPCLRIGETKMDLRKLKKLIDLVQESGIAELEITEGEEKVKIVKGGGISVVPVSAVAAHAAPAVEAPRAAAAAPAAAPAAAAEP